MNVYDFDKTIYDGDSTLDFYFFALKSKHSIIKYLPFQIYGFLKYIFGKSTKLEFKERFYSFLQGIDNIDEQIEKFWDKQEFKIKKWYLRNKKNSDLIISASPRFLLEPICNRMKVDFLIASKVNKYTGTCEGENCYGKEKVIQLNKQFANIEIVEFYSDSLTDEPISKLAQRSYIVSGQEIIEWEKYKPNVIKRFFF